MVVKSGTFIGEKIGVGRIEYDDADVISKLLDGKNKNTASGRQKSGSVTVDGMDNLLTHVSRCCQPVPGDEIVGFITKGRGVSIHRRNCLQLKKLAMNEPDRVISAQWGNVQSGTYSLTMRITGIDYSGLLRDVTTLITNDKVNITGVRSRIEKEKMISVIDVDMLINDISSFDRIRTKISALSGVTSVERL